MRLVILIIGGVAIGAGSVTGVQTILPHVPSMSGAVRALGGQPGSLRLSDININPFKAYDDVRREITSGHATAPFGLGGSAPVTSFTRLDFSKINTFKLDEGAIKRSMAAGINAQIQQNYNRSQDLAAYGRNPMGWHGAPPH